MKTYIIMSGGPGTRWGNHLGCPKHLVEVDGERLIERTVRLLNENGQYSVIILGPKEYDRRYNVMGTRHIQTSGLYDCFHELFTPLTDAPDDYILLGGDVWYTEACVQAIVEGHDWVGRWTPSRHTGQLHEELWAVRMTPENRPVLQAELEMAKKKLSRATAWDVLRSFKRKNKPIDFFTVDDMTCDFDTPEDYDTWMNIYKGHDNGTAA
jgi:MobA-like NTP transferase domain